MLVLLKLHDISNSDSQKKLSLKENDQYPTLGRFLQFYQGTIFKYTLYFQKSSIFLFILSYPVLKILMIAPPSNDFAQNKMSFEILRGI